MKTVKHVWYRIDRKYEGCRHCDIHRALRTKSKYHYFIKINNEYELHTFKSCIPK